MKLYSNERQEQYQWSWCTLRKFILEKVILLPPLNHLRPQLLNLLFEKIDICIPWPKNDVFLMKLTIVKRRIPFCFDLHRKKNQLLQPQVLISFYNSKKYSKWSQLFIQARHKFPFSKLESTQSVIHQFLLSVQHQSYLKFFQLQSIKESTPFTLPVKLLPSRQPYSLLQMHLNFGLLKYSSSERFLLFTIFNFNLPSSPRNNCYQQDQFKSSSSLQNWVSKKNVLGAIISGRRTVLNQFAGICSLIFLLISIFRSSSTRKDSLSVQCPRKHSSLSSILLVLIITIDYRADQFDRAKRMIGINKQMTFSQLINNNLQIHQKLFFYNLLFMEKDEGYQQDLAISIKPRNFKCPCGKSYLSYAALFTHIKQKHEGKAPGKISKPPSQYQKRGRPPVKPRNQKRDRDSVQETQNLPVQTVPAFPPETEEERARRQRNAEIIVAQIAQFLSQMPSQELNKDHLHEIQVFAEMNVYLNTRVSPSPLIHGSICVADGFFEFARSVCSQISWKAFQPFYLLFMLFLQFIMDTQGNKRLLTESNMDIFCDHINDFIENHMLDMAEYYQLQNLWIVKRQNSIRIFFNFFHWCMYKRYVSYQINMATQDPQIKDQLREPTSVKIE